jgi:cytosine permease
MTGWWGVNTELFANAVADLAKEVFHCQLSREFTILVGGCAMITTAALGIRAIGRLSYLAVPLLLAGLAHALVNFSGAKHISAVLAHTPDGGCALTFGGAAATVASGFIVGASMNPDFSRFAKTRKHAVAYALSDYSFVYPMLLTVCGILAIAAGKSNVMLYLVPPGFTWLLFVMMMFATWAANDCNLYSTSLSLAAVLPKWSRSHLAIAAGIHGIILAELHVTAHMVSFLCLLGILIAPISGVFVINSLSRKTAVTQEELDMVPDWQVAPLIAWACGTAIGFLATPKASLGLGLIQLSTMPTLDAIIAAGSVMLCLNLSSKYLKGTSRAKSHPVIENLMQ